MVHHAFSDQASMGVTIFGLHVTYRCSPATGKTLAGAVIDAVIEVPSRLCPKNCAKFRGKQTLRLMSTD